MKSLVKTKFDRMHKYHLFLEKHPINMKNREFSDSFDERITKDNLLKYGEPIQGTKIQPTQDTLDVMRGKYR